jgi:hypothetical protein
VGDLISPQVWRQQHSSRPESTGHADQGFPDSALDAMLTCRWAGGGLCDWC